MILFLTRATVTSPRELDVSTLPKRFLTLGRRLYPRKMFGKLYWRTLFETPVTRYCLALSIFPIALFLKPEWALPISLAPVPMAMFVLMFETYVLSVPSPTARRALIDETEAERGLDLLRSRAETVLGRLAAGRDLGAAPVHLVIEQSDLLRIAPLIYISVQREHATSVFVELSEDEQQMISSTLFDDALTEEKLLLINVSQDKQIRGFSRDPASVSAHARLAAIANAQEK